MATRELQSNTVATLMDRAIRTLHEQPDVKYEYNMVLIACHIIRKQLRTPKHTEEDKLLE